MSKFAVYYIPPAESGLYQRGSEILGYDVREGMFLPENNASRAALPEFDPAWVERPQTYGFHVTTGYSLYFDPERLADIEMEIAHVVGCFSPGLEFRLTPAKEHVTIWNDNIVVLRYEPNSAMLMLHTMLTARVNPLGTGSNISRQTTSVSGLDPVYVRRVQRYYTPYMLDSWVPHFTLMMPYTGQQPTAMRAALATLFLPVVERVGSVSLLLRAADESHYRLYRDFPLK